MSTYGNPNAPLVGGAGSKFSHSLPSGHARGKEKALKALEEKHCFVLGHNVFIDKVETLCRKALIRRLEYASMSKKEWVLWATAH